MIILLLILELKHIKESNIENQSASKFYNLCNMPNKFIMELIIIINS